MREWVSAAATRRAPVLRGLGTALPWLLVLGLDAPSATAQLGLTLVPSLPSPQGVGSTIVWSAAIDRPEAQVAYRFEAREAGRNWRLVRDFSGRSTLEWTSLEEGVHEMRVRAVDLVTGETEAKVAPFVLGSRLSGPQPAAFATAHPLVALYASPPCVGATTWVRFKPTAAIAWQATPPKPCRPERSVNFYVAGMREDTLHALQQVIGGPGRLLPVPSSSSRPAPPPSDSLPFS